MHGRAALISAVFLLAPASAQAATYTVNQSTGDDINPCSAASPCKTINAAISKARSVSPPPPANTISVSKGTYTDHLKLDDVRDDGLTIDGVRNIFFGSTVIKNTTGDTNTLSLEKDNITFRDLVVQVANTSGSSTGAAITGDNATFFDVAFSMTTAANASQAILPFSTASGLTLDLVSIGGDWTGSAVVGQGTGLTVRDSSIAAGKANGVHGVQIDGSLDVARSRIIIPPESTSGGTGINVSPSAAGAHVTIDSSEITGGQDGAIFDVGGGDGVVPILIRHDTFDQQTLGKADIGSDSVQANSLSNGTAATTISDSIAVESPEFTGIGALTCRNSDMSTASCSTDGGGNAHSPLSALFVDPAKRDYRLATGSPAIDSGSTDSLAAGESATDRVGNPRIVDGNFDCTGRRDKGAYEVQGQSNTAPSASISAPDATLAGASVALAGSGSDAEDAGLGFAWMFSDGGTAGGQNVEHAFPAGDQTATLTVSDSHGCTGTATHPLTVAQLAASPLPADAPPVISGVSLSHPVFAPVGAKATAVRRRVPRGTTFRYTLSEPARVTIAIERARPGRRVARRCLAPTRARRRLRTCTRYVRKATLTNAGAKQGRNSTPFSARVRGRALARGRYRGRLGARDPAGKAARERTVGFRIVRP